MMKIYLDDLRPCPEGWILFKRVEEAFDFIVSHRGEIDEISLDNDLGYELEGYNLLNKVEELVVLDNYPLPIIHIHTSNPAARKKMEQAVNFLIKYTGS